MIDPMHALAHPVLVTLLLDAGAHIHLCCMGGVAAKGVEALEPGTALENAEHAGHTEAAALLRAHAESKLTAAGAAAPPPRDVFAREAEVLMTLSAAHLLETQARTQDSQAVPYTEKEKGICDEQKEIYFAKQA